MNIFRVIMDSLGYIVTFYFFIVCIINIGAFILMAIDKRNAKKEGQRIPEIVLLTIALIGGGVGVLLGMVFFHHKISKRKFYIGIPLLYILNVITSLWVLYFFNK
ncbi:DUF1294 domain-containing protein [Alkaliphilus peptidifermentans]|uniref:Uncharacterized membrane protein YsdA, DUF1294 family n=1 Tax=Alkaliphilus peptidifermentans DSM 18978 TaxID=1120976 RepID=A0A1G5KT19_9FIRM|nr:DUF1294 domain-containing protein [Alkaliphilus peptidifermentans]SCZ03756.1 Uncharacterized membrane protein YsdA, DUF1294 family [Alkaliphilus peptidifermentans DSM 18978]